MKVFHEHWIFQKFWSKDLSPWFSKGTKLRRKQMAVVNPGGISRSIISITWGHRWSQNDNFVSKYLSSVAAILKLRFRDHVTPIFQTTRFRTWACNPVRHQPDQFMVQGGRFKNEYELLNLRALKIWMLCKNHIFQCMGTIFCVEFQRAPLKFHTKYLTHILKDVDFIHRWTFKSS